ncbi:hypothetical protein BBJK_01829 [Bifidobacterium bifidum LMG 13195]|uniref:Uncharacterized protein n=1 Tax=Bifidobacterium bifidum LMG 13195 TaxID=1207542 RepID=A0A286TE96_BIFBI|nr:hypothetical protein BBJK_01829 [Bifidobacterium bifidum LMG 13195]
MNGHSIHKITHNALPYLDPRFSPGSLTPPAAEQPRSLCPPQSVRRSSQVLKLRVEIADSGNSPCEIAVFRPQNDHLARGIPDNGYFTP